MATLTLRAVLGRFGKSANPAAPAATPDQELLARFLGDRDEQAFSALMERHGGMVLGVCRRVLRNSHDAEEACQAAFLVLARRADSIRKTGSLASWLHGVAWRAAHKLRTRLARSHAHEASAAAQKPIDCDPEDISWRELQRLVDDELNRLPKTYGAPLVLCYLEGRTQDEAARELGVSLAAVRGRLERGREMLRLRLTRRGVTGASALAIAALVPSLSSAAMPAGLVATTSSASLAVAAGNAIPAAVPAQVALLTREVLQVPLLAKIMAAAGLTASAAAALCLAVLVLPESGPQQDPKPAPSATPLVWSDVGKLEVPNAHVWSVAYSPDGKRLAAGSAGPNFASGNLRVWDTDSRQELFAIATPHPVRCVAFAPDGKTLACAEHDGIARLRDAESGDVLFTLSGHRTQIDAVAFSTDGKLVATSGWDQTVRLWDTATGELVRTLLGHTSQVFTVAFGGGAFGNSDGMLASGGVDGTARIWRAATGETVGTLVGHTSVVHWLAFSPADGKTIATASWDKTVKLWDATTGNLKATLQGHTELALAVAFSHDGKTLASSASRRMNRVSSAPSEVVLWDLAARKARARLHLKDHVYGLAFSPDDRTLATTCFDGTVTLWRQEPDERPAVVGPEKPGDLKFVVAQAGDGGAPELKKDYAEEYHPSLQDKASVAGLAPYGPEASDCVKFEPMGLRIALPLAYPKQRPGTGVVTDFGVKGDFEITAGYEIVQEPNAGLPGNPTDFRLVVVPQEPTKPGMWHKPNQNRSALVRVAAGRGQIGQFFADATTWNNEDIPKDQWGNEIFNNIEMHTNQRTRALAKAGRLRLVRNGSVLYFYTSEDLAKDFTLFAKHEFGAKDLKNVRLLGSTGGPNASLDMRVTDFQIRADAFVKTKAPTLELAATTGPASAERELPVVPLAIAAIAVVLGLAFGVWLLARKRQGAAPEGAAPVKQDVSASAAPAIVFRCPSCGKQLKAKAERVGVKVKCPQCGNATVVPQTSAPSKEAP